jgi:catechol 2,3-dioxygenase-like lactoylglutathione lyase family enzyme
MRLSMHSVLVFAPDLDRARHFYEEFLGLHLDRMDESYLLFQCAGFQLAVFLCELESTSDNYSREAGSSIAFSVPDLDVAVAELTAKGVRFLHSTPNEGPIGRYVAFANPFGIVHELVEAPK